MTRMQLLGNLVADPEMVQREGKDLIANFTLASGKRNKSDDGPDSDFFKCTAYGRQAELLEKYCKKGTRLWIEGRVETNNYTQKDGTKVYSYKITVMDLEFGSKKSDVQSSENDSNSNFQDAPIDAADIPFR